jgi:hypothetical protein
VSSILYCRCAYAQVVPSDVKDEVLARLSSAGAAFEAVPDLCALSAHKDPALQRIAAQPELRIAACYPRAVRWLFHAGGAPLPEAATILNMRTDTAEVVAAGVLGESGGTP